MYNIRGAGLYHVIGKNFEILAKIVGKEPCYQVVTGVLLNDFIMGKVTALDASSIEITHINENPSEYLFKAILVSGAITCPGITTRTTTQLTEYCSDEFKAWINRYIELQNAGINESRLIAELCIDKGYCFSQAQLILREIKKKIV